MKSSYCLPLLALQFCCHGAAAASPTIPVYSKVMTVDSSGNIYLAGADGSGSLPAPPGEFHVDQCPGEPGGGPPIACTDAFVMKLDPTGRKVLYAIYIGGSSNDGIDNIAVDASGNAYVTGTTNSRDLSVTAGALQRSYASNFVAKVNPDGSLNYLTYFGTTGGDQPIGIQVDPIGFAYVAGLTNSKGFPITSNAYRSVPGPGFVAKINRTGTALVYATYFDAPPTALAVSAYGSVYLTGSVYPLSSATGQLTTTPGALRRTPCGTKQCGFLTS